MKSRKVLISFPEPLLKRLDKAAKQQDRNRSAELCLRLNKTLKPTKPGRQETTA